MLSLSQKIRKNMKKTSLSIKPPIITSIILLLLAILPLPYGYYTLLRLVVCLTAAFLAWFSYKAQKVSWMWVMGFIALIFNPLIPLHLGRELWFIIDLIVAVVFGIFLLKFRK